MCPLIIYVFVVYIGKLLHGCRLKLRSLINITNVKYIRLYIRLPEILR